MKLHTLKRSKGLQDKSKRLGRGNASGKGNYSTKGLKGQKARSGHSMKAFFEWGQTSIVQRIPKAKGFKRFFKLVKEYDVINLGALDLDERITDGIEISKALLWELGYIKHIENLVKILGDGDWTKNVKFVDIDLFSKSAQDKIANPSAKGEKKAKKVAVEKKAPAKVTKPVAKEEKKVVAKEEVKEEKKAPAKKAVAKKEPTEKKAPAKKAPAKKK